MSSGREPVSSLWVTSGPRQPNQALSLLISDVHGTSQRTTSGPREDHEDANATDSILAFSRPEVSPAVAEADHEPRSGHEDPAPFDPVAEGPRTEAVRILGSSRRR